MKRERLTPARIDQHTCPPDKKQAFLWDEESPRLAVRVTAGSKSFVFESKLHGATIRITIGDVRSWPLSSVFEGRGKDRREVRRGAREEANRLQALIDQGVDPREVEREKIAARKREQVAAIEKEQEVERQKRYTLRALCDAYVEWLGQQGKKGSARDAKSVFKCHVSDEFAKLSARDVTALQLAAMIRKAATAGAGKGRVAGLLRSFLSAAYNVAKRAPLDTKLPSDFIGFGVMHNPVDAIPAIPVNAGHRVLTVDELRAYMAALNDDLADRALKLALYAGGQRMSQLLRAKVGDYDAQRQALLLWDGKGKRREPRAHLLPLGPDAAAQVDELIRRAKDKETDWLFSSFGTKKMDLASPSCRAGEICKSMNCPPFDLRDIRRTCETMLAAMGISKDTRAQLLSHGISGVQAVHYDRHDYFDQKRAALIAWENKLREVRDGVVGASTNVISLSAKK